MFVQLGDMLSLLNSDNNAIKFRAVETIQSRLHYLK